MDTLTRNDMVLAPVGGSHVDVHDLESGELLMQIPVWGVSSAVKLLRLLPPGAGFTVPSDVQIVPKGPIAEEVYGEGFAETSMVEGYQPSQALEMARLIDSRLKLREADIVKKVAATRAVVTARGSEDVEAEVRAELLQDEDVPLVEDDAEEVSDGKVAKP